MSNSNTPCKKCKMACLGNGLMNCIQCDICDHWFHEKCANLDYSLECYQYYDLDFICSEKCLLSILPFHSVTQDANVPDFYTNIDSYPCKLCRNECLGFGLMNCVQRSICDCWLHADCLNLSQLEFDNLANSSDEFICSKRCEMLLLPFHSVSFEYTTEVPSDDSVTTISQQNFNAPLITSNEQSKTPIKSYPLNNQSVYFDQFLDINCSYLKPECLKNDYFKSSDSELVVMHNNVCSLSSNFHKIEELFLGSTYHPNILASTEPNLILHL